MAERARGRRGENLERRKALLSPNWRSGQSGRDGHDGRESEGTSIAMQAKSVGAIRGLPFRLRSGFRATSAKAHDIRETLWSRAVKAPASTLEPASFSLRSPGHEGRASTVNFWLTRREEGVR